LIYDFDEIFPVKVYNFLFKDRKKFNSELIKAINKHKTKEDSIERSNKGGYHSLLDINMKSIDVFDELNNRIIDVVNGIIIKEDYKHLDKIEELSSMWFIINKKNDYNSTHMHPGSWFSGAYYIKVPENDSKYLVFEDPLQIRNYNQDTPNSFMKEVMEGMLLIFPGWFNHAVPKNNTDEERIVISFNIPKPNLLSSHKELLDQ
tara:strand:- start:9113 stop:9724 length:612 start_codon:yes stop_codon:yes gene_type:complete